MDIIPVLDLSRGVAVRAQAGDRARYEPVESVLTPASIGDPIALLRAFRSRLGATVEAQRLLGRARSELEFLAPGRLLETLETRLAALQKTCFDVGEALAQQYFYSAPWVAWTDAGHNGLVIEEGEI